MRFETKFSFYDKVYAIMPDQEKTWIPCAFCAGEGRIIGQNKEKLSCPICHNVGGEYNHNPTGWFVSQPMTICKVSVTRKLVEQGKQWYSYKEEYMCHESGSLWGLENLFRTISEAQVSCNVLNNSKTN